MAWKIEIKRPSFWKSLFCKHDFKTEISEAKLSDIPDDKFVIQYDTCGKCGLELQETLHRPKPRVVKLTTTAIIE